MNGVHQIVCLELRVSHVAAQAHGAQYAPARSDDLRAFTARAAVKHFTRQGRCRLETVDWITLAVGIRVAARSHHHAESRARVPANLVFLQRTPESRLA